MASTPPLIPVLGGRILQFSTNQVRAYNNVNSTVHNYPYEFSITLFTTILGNYDQGSPGYTQFDATSVKVGQWLI